VTTYTLTLTQTTRRQSQTGKGLHSHEEFNGLMANINPASENFKGRPKGKGQFIPGSCSVIVFCCYVDDE
jgi:hypothetical protein